MKRFLRLATSQLEIHTAMAPEHVVTLARSLSFLTQDGWRAPFWLATLRVATLYGHFATAFGPGWRPLLRSALEEMTSAEWRAFAPCDVVIEGMKEKYGALVVSYSCPNAISGRVGRIFEGLERRSARTCDVCGRRGRVRAEHSWWTTRCGKHNDWRPWCELTD